DGSPAKKKSKKEPVIGKASPPVLPPVPTTPLASPGLGGAESDGHSSDGDRKRKKARTTFTGRQIFELERQFELKKYLSSSERADMAKLLGVTETQFGSYLTIEWCQRYKTSDLGLSYIVQAQILSVTLTLVLVLSTLSTPPIILFDTILAQANGLCSDHGVTARRRACLFVAEGLICEGMIYRFDGEGCICIIIPSPSPSPALPPFVGPSFDSGRWLTIAPRIEQFVGDNFSMACLFLASGVEGEFD
ncbi:hypothetical protein J6590_013435, partial [Homalodisca vitripennis]